MARNRVRKVILWVALTILIIWWAGPFVYSFVCSFKTNFQLMVYPPNLQLASGTKYGPFRNYWAILLNWAFGGETPSTAGTRDFPQYAKSIPRALFNGTVIGLGVVALSLGIGTLSAYSLSRLNFKGKRHLSLLVLSAAMVPRISIGIPFFYLFNTAQLLDTHIGVILAHSSFDLPYAVWLLMGFFRTVPMVLEEAAMIDGCSRLGAIRRVLIPISGPGLMATGIFLFLSSWSEFYLVNILTSSDAARTMTVVIGMFATEKDVDYGLMHAAGIVGAIPPLIFALVFQKYLTTGLTAGAVKG